MTNSQEPTAIVRLLLSPRHGSRVEVVGLRLKPELNGSLGTVQAFKSSTGRYPILSYQIVPKLCFFLHPHLSVSFSFALFLSLSRLTFF